MLQPISLQLAHFNVEHTAQISKDAIAAAQQTGQVKEVIEESVKRAQMVEASIAAAEAKKVKRKEEEEERERRQGKKQDQFFSGQSDSSEEDAELVAAGIEENKFKKATKSFELYA